MCNISGFVKEDTTFYVRRKDAAIVENGYGYLNIRGYYFNFEK